MLFINAVYSCCLVIVCIYCFIILIYSLCFAIQLITELNVLMCINFVYISMLSKLF